MKRNAMNRLLPFETLDDASTILNQLKQQHHMSATWNVGRFLADAINGDINLVVILPEIFNVAKKNQEKEYLDTPLRPSFPKGSSHFFVTRKELFNLSVEQRAELTSVSNISNDGVVNTFYSIKPFMTISVSDLRISGEQLMQYIRTHEEEIRRFQECLRSSNLQSNEEKKVQPVTTSSGILVHKIETRLQPLQTEIALAAANAVNAEDPKSVWVALTLMAENGTGAMIGFSSDGIQYRGKKYQSSGLPDVFTFKNLRERMKRAKTRRDV
jgi:hypothetical protein